MKLINKTNWNTRDLRKFVNLVTKHEGFKPRTIEFITRNSNVRGRAVVNGSWIRLNTFSNGRESILADNGVAVNRDCDTIEGMRLLHLAGTLSHEIAHNRGLRHNTMNCNRFHNESVLQSDYGFLNNIVIRKQVQEEKPKMDKVLQRKLNAIKRVEELTKTIKRKTNALKKWQRKVKYYQKKEVKQ